MPLTLLTRWVTFFTFHTLRIQTVSYFYIYLGLLVFLTERFSFLDLFPMLFVILFFRFYWDTYYIPFMLGIFFSGVSTLSSNGTVRSHFGNFSQLLLLYSLLTASEVVIFGHLFRPFQFTKAKTH